MKRSAKTLSSRIVLTVLVSVILTMTIGLLVQRNTIRNKTLNVMKDEMTGVLVGAGRVADTISELGHDAAFDMDALLQEVEEIGAENYRESTLFKTVPVVAAWKTIEKAAAETDLTFRILTNEARNEKNFPVNDWERAILDEIEDPANDEVFFEDKKEGVIAYARPILLKESCLACHGNPANSKSGDGNDILGFAMEGWEAGDVRGAFLLTASTDQIKGPVREAMAQSIMWTLPVAILLILGAIRIINSTNRKLKHTIEQLDSGSQELNAASLEVSQSSSSLAEGASQQAASLEESSAAMDDLTRLVERNADVARTTSDHAKESSVSASRGMQSVIEMKDRVGAVHSAAEEMNTAMLAIKDSSSSISKIIRTIDEIAFQTNILSLNAAVEAARAGEAGAGFAVVADEVRSLANRAADAAKETTNIIEDSIEKTELGAKMNEQVVTNLQEVIERAGEVQTGLEDITSGVNKVDSAMNELAASVQEQGDGIVQISNAINQVNEITQANAAAAEETASSSEVLNAQSVALQSVLGKLQEVVSGENKHKNDAIAPNKNGFALPSDDSQNPKLTLN